jgi:hypothetical protein
MDWTPRPDCDYISARPQYILALKVITGVFSGLSLFGALTVIFFHVCCSRLWPHTSKDIVNSASYLLHAIIDIMGNSVQ